eukprot:jgi/Mesvir1/2766/Mv11553-RA.2
MEKAKKKEKSIAIIGGGIAGLSTAIYARMNNFRVDVYESSSNPGGLCNGWFRQGFRIDGCINAIPTKGLASKLWREIGATTDAEGTPIKWLPPNPFVHIFSADGSKQLVVGSQLASLEQNMRALSRGDRNGISAIVTPARALTRFDPPLSRAVELWGVPDKVVAAVQLLPLWRTVEQHKGESVASFVDKHVKDPFLARALGLVMHPLDPKHVPLTAMQAVLGALQGGGYAYPLGGSVKFARAVERRALDLGAQIHYNNKVENVIVEDDAAVGVVLRGGEQKRADYVVSACDGRKVLATMLQGKYGQGPGQVLSAFSELAPADPICHVSIGVGADLSGLPAHAVWMLDPPVKIAGVEQTAISMRHYCQDPEMAPAGKSVLVSLLPSDFKHWAPLHRNRDKYAAEKEAVTKAVVALLEERCPGLKGKVEMADVATPLTYALYSGNWRGAWTGWRLDSASFCKSLRKDVTGLANMFIAGERATMRLFD